MSPEIIVKELESKAALKKAWLILLVSSFSLNLLLALNLLFADRTHREILVPPEINKTFWVEDKKASSSYLEQMGLFIIRNALDVTPAMYEYQIRQILRYSSPAAYGQLEKQLLAQGKRLTRDNISTFFSITGVGVFEETQTVRFTGQLRTMLADKTVSDTPKVYDVSFGMNNGRVYLLAIKEYESTPQTTDERTR
jgi:conjugal transfer pilus assembly protein TraE